ncbi:hypothetical protein PGT21_005552 [Puccinia graminis f. sp. tritici]|uniref:Superoxide dismutase copper/zinc binding domain-containing protein n=1 Tax=Puccinia graminis f. sp. tritici TaxID=56615 RepID=A0A5B0Q9R3_PUCGR|nr:hypothetical protein PGT21_005552 [Puccinia graminis f. sp. tritici]
MLSSNRNFSTLSQLSILLWFLSVIVGLGSALPQPPKKKYPFTARAVLKAGQFEAEISFWLFDKPSPTAKSPKVPGYLSTHWPLPSVSIVYSGVLKNQGFSYHIHESAITGNDCKSSGNHWNPTGSKFTGPKAFYCKPERPSRCESGDLSGKHGKLVPGPNNQRISYLDPSLKLSYSRRGILGKSIVVHNQSGAMIACANIVASN